MAPEAWALFLLGAFIAEVIGTTAGFGAATVLTPIATLFLDMKTSITVVACFHLFGNASRLVFFGRHIQWKTWWAFGLTGVLCSLIGAEVTASLPSSAVKRLFGGFLLLYVGWSLQTGERMPLRPTRLTLMGGGACSGFVAGLLGTGGAIRSACLLVFGLSKEAYIGTSAAIALVVDATRLPVYLAGGLLPGQLAPVLASLVVVAFCGAWLGQRLVRRVPAGVFRRGVLVLLALFGLKFLIEGWRGVG